MAKTIAGEDLYTDESGKLVSAGPKARMLVVREGRPIPKAHEGNVGADGKIKKARKRSSNKETKPGGDK